MTENLSIRELIVAVERRKGISICCPVTLEELARSLLYRWPEDDRGVEWVIAQHVPRSHGRRAILNRLERPSRRGPGSGHAV